MSNYLVLHIDKEFIAGVVCASSGRSFPIKNGDEELLWLYFYNDPRQNKVTFGKENKSHFNDLETNYYGDFFNNIFEDNVKFTIRSTKRPLIELLDNSGLINTLKKSYLEKTQDGGLNIPTLITFSSSISNSAKQQLVKYLTSLNFNIISYTIPLSELICYSYCKENKIKANKGKVVLFLKATNSTLHLMKLNYMDNYFFIEENVSVSYKGKGFDPRKKSILKYVITEVNNSTGVLSTPEEIEKECERFESSADEWLKRIDAVKGTNPINIRNISFSLTPNMKREVLVRKKDVESDTGYYINELIDTYNVFESDVVKEKARIASVILFGDCFNNNLIKKKFENQIDKDKLLISTTNEIFNVLAVYPSIDFNRYSDHEERIKALAKAEDDVKIQLLASESKRKNEEEIEIKKQLEFKKVEEKKKRANQLFQNAIALEKNGKLLDAISNIETSLELDPINNEMRQFSISLKEQKIELDIKTKQYKVFFSDAEKQIVKGKLAEALKKFELAKSIFDSSEIRNLIIETKFKIREIDINKEKIENLLIEVKSLFENKRYIEAKDKIASVLELDLNNLEAKNKQIEINKLLRQLEDEFKKIIKQADVYFKSGKFDEAKNFYNKALGVNSKDKYCLGQLSKIESELINIVSKKVEFDKLVQVAENYFNQNNWTQAKLQYEDALSLFPNDSNTKNQISQIGFKIIEDQKKYNSLLKSANQDFENGLWEIANEKFEKLQEIKPDDKAIKEKLRILKIKLSFGDINVDPEIPDETGGDWSFGVKKNTKEQQKIKNVNTEFDFGKNKNNSKHIDTKTTINLSENSKKTDTNKKFNF